MHLALATDGYTKPQQFDALSATTKAQEKIYELTRPYLQDHPDTISLTEKLRLSFKEPPSQQLWSTLMNEVNKPEILEPLMRAPQIVAAFRTVLAAEPVWFPIGYFRAQFPWMDRSVYAWHQDMGTWYASKAPWLAYQRPVTLWLSLNGADRTNSLEIAKGSHRDRLHKHVRVTDQGDFQARMNFVPEEKYDTYIPECAPGEGVFFDDLCLHRSCRGQYLIPRYSIDIRYYSGGKNALPKVPVSFRLKRFFRAAFS